MKTNRIILGALIALAALISFSSHASAKTVINPPPPPVSGTPNN
jgi:hypothetical protein